MLEERELNQEHFQKYNDISMDDTPEDPEAESKVYQEGSRQDPEIQRLTGKEILAKIKREKMSLYDDSFFDERLSLYVGKGVASYSSDVDILEPLINKLD